MRNTRVLWLFADSAFEEGAGSHDERTGDNYVAMTAIPVDFAASSGPVAGPSWALVG